MADPATEPAPENISPEDQQSIDRWMEFLRAKSARDNQDRVTEATIAGGLKEFAGQEGQWPGFEAEQKARRTPGKEVIHGTPVDFPGQEIPGKRIGARGVAQAVGEVVIGKEWYTPEPEFFSAEHIQFIRNRPHVALAQKLASREQIENILGGPIPDYRKTSFIQERDAAAEKMTGKGKAKKAAAKDAAKTTAPGRTTPGTTPGGGGGGGIGGILTLGEEEALKSTILGREEYTPFKEVTGPGGEVIDQGAIYQNAQDRIFANSTEIAKRHDDILALKGEQDKLIGEKARFAADTALMEQDVAEDKETEAHLRMITSLQNQKKYQSNLQESEAFLRRAMAKFEASEEMTGWDIFRKSAIAVGALAAAAGQVVGSIALAKQGGMPNVLMPLISKAIDADIAAMKASRAAPAKEAAAAVEIYKGLRAIWKDVEVSDIAARSHIIKHLDAKLNAYKLRLPEGGKRQVIEEAQRALEIEAHQTEIKFRQAYEKSLTESSDAMVKSIKNQEDFKGAFVNRNLNTANALATLKNMSAASGDKLARPKLTANQENDIGEDMKILMRIPHLKASMVKLVNKYDMGMWDQAIDLTLDDFFGRFRGGPEHAVLRELAGSLAGLGRLHGAAIEDGRLTNEDAQFWADAMGTDLSKINIATAFTKVMSMEYYTRQNLLNTASMMNPAQLSMGGKYYLPMMGALRGDPRELLENYTVSVKAGMKKTKDEQKNLAYNVGLSEVADGWRFKKAEWAQMQNEMQNQFYNGLTAGDSVPKRKAMEAAVEERVGEVTRDRPFANSVAIPTWPNEETGAPQQAFLKPEMAASFKAMSEEAKLAGVDIRASGDASGQRTSGDTARLRAAGLEPAERGGHTKAGGFNAIDIKVHGTTKSAEYKWMAKNGHFFGFYPHGVPGYQGHWHWVYDPKRKTGH